MGFLENQHTHSYNPFDSNLIFYCCYINDIFLIIRHSQSELTAFREYFNSLSDTIKLNMEFSTSAFHFLDTQITLTDGKLSSSLYVKPTDKNSLLHATSFHTLPLKRALPYSQFLRVKRICTHSSDFELKAKKLYEFVFQFVSRGYLESWLNLAYLKISPIPYPQGHPLKKNLDLTNKSRIS